MREALVLVVLACLGTASLMVASLVPGLPGPTRLLLAYLVAWLQLVLWPVALTLFSAVTVPGIMLLAGISTSAAVGLWAIRGRPPILPSAAVRASAIDQFRDPLVLILASSVVFVYAYLALVGLFLPQNDGDPLVYQLTRAALWRQQQSVGIVGDGVELRLDGNPPVAELGATVWLTLGGERYVWIGQYAATVVLALAAGTLALRAGFSTRQAALSSLIVPTLAVVAVQSPTAYNDTIVASFIVSAVVFACGKTSGEVAGLTLSSALAVGTKFTGVLLFVLPVAVALSAQPVRRWFRVGVALFVGAILGSAWYVVNVLHTNSLTGGIAEERDQVPERTVSGMLLRIQQLILDAWDLSGGQATWLLLYAALGVLLMLHGFFVLRSHRGSAWGYACAGAALIVLPFAVAQTHSVLASAFEQSWDAMGDREAARAFEGSVVWRGADGAKSWFGVVFAPMATATLAVCTWGAVRRRLPLTTLILAAAPVLACVVLAVTIVYDPWRGRFFIAAAVMSVAMWGSVMRVHGVAVLVSVASVVSLVSTVATWEGKPTGIALLDGRDAESVWTMPRWKAQTLLRGFTSYERGELTVIENVERRVPHDATIALRLDWNDFRFPALGGDLSRTVMLVSEDEALPRHAAWAVLAPGLPAVRCERAWRTAVSAEAGWMLLKRQGSDRACK